MKASPELFTELLVLPDGTIYAHNLTPTLAHLLTALNPADLSLQHRATQESSRIRPQTAASDLHLSPLVP